MTVTAPSNAIKTLTRRVFFQFAAAPLKAPLQVCLALNVTPTWSGFSGNQAISAPAF
jgi:hypothetical protein